MWRKAVTVAKRYKRPELDQLVSKYARDLLDQGLIVQAIQLYRSADRLVDTARLLIQVLYNCMQWSDCFHFNMLRWYIVH